MTGKILPRYVILVSTLTLVVIGIMLSIFYGQYRWLASGIVSSSVEQHELSLNASFERQARGALHRIADSLSGAEADDFGTKMLVLSEAIAHSSDLVGLRYVQSDGVNVQSGYVDGTPQYDNPRHSSIVEHHVFNPAAVEDEKSLPGRTVREGSGRVH